MHVSVLAVCSDGPEKTLDSAAPEHSGAVARRSALQFFLQHQCNPGLQTALGRAQKTAAARPPLQGPAAKTEPPCRFLLRPAAPCCRAQA